MTEDQDPALAARRRRGRGLAGPALGLLAGLLTWQMLHAATPAITAAVASGVVTFALWGGFVVRPEGASYGRAAGLGLAATLVAFFGAAAVGVTGTPVADPAEAVSLAVFALFMALPVMIGGAIALAFLSARRG